MATAEQLNTRLQNQIDYIVESIQNIKQDNLVDMKPMDDEVASICGEIEKSDKETAQKTEAKMVELIGLLDQLALELDHYKNRATSKE